MRKHQHTEIRDAVVVTALVVVGLVVFAAVMIASLATNATAVPPAEPTPHVSSCWRVPYKLQYPTELQCQLERLNDRNA